MSLWTELKRRNVVRVSTAYVLVAWVVLQILDFTLDVIDAPNWIMQLLVVIAAIGLVGAAIFAWVYEMTPEGLKLERDVDRSASITSETGKKLNFVIIGTLAVAVAVLSYRQFVAPTAPPTGTAPMAADPIAEQAEEAEETVPSIAVLPFEDYSQDGDQEYFSKGIAEEMLNLLAKTDALRVAARTSSFALAGTGADIREIGDKLEVDTVLEGSIRKAGDQIRITAQLINVEDGYHIWSETYDREYKDIFAIQDEIAAAIMDSLRIHLIEEEEARMHVAVAANVDAYSAYLIGRERMALRLPADLEAARAQFEEAIALDPGYAPARVGLAFATLLLEQNFYTGEDVDPAITDAVVSPELARALALNPDDPEAIAVRGYQHLLRDRFDEARADFDRALELNPNYAQAYAWRADLAAEEERYLDLLADKEKAYALDPMSLQLSADLAGVYRNFWRPEDAERIIDRMFDLHPDHLLAFEAAASNLANHGRYGEAVHMIERAIVAHPQIEPLRHFRNHALIWLGLLDEAKATQDQDVPAMAEAYGGNFDEARALVEAGLATEESPGKWLRAAIEIYHMDTGEGSKTRLRALLDRQLAYYDQRNENWREDCDLFLIHQLRQVGLEDETGGMMAECEKRTEGAFRDRYLCPCRFLNVVFYNILAGNHDEAVKRADFWLSSGDSWPRLHMDPIFSELAERPEYGDLLARNAAQLERQQEIYLSNRVEPMTFATPAEGP